jgi:hypothetical protein
LLYALQAGQAMNQTNAAMANTPQVPAIRMVAAAFVTSEIVP